MKQMSELLSFQIPYTWIICFTAQATALRSLPRENLRCLIPRFPCARWPGRQPSFSLIFFENDAIAITAGTEKTRRAESASNVSIRFVTSEWLLLRLFGI